MNINIFHLLGAIGLGLVGGTVRACQGGYKDSPWEKFKWGKFRRSLFFGMLGGVFWYVVLTWQGKTVPPALFLGMAVFFDSIITEIYKRGFRVESLKKYKMPTILHVYGHIIHNRVLRGFIGLLILVFLIGVYALLGKIDSGVTVSPEWKWLWGMFWGSVAGTMVALGGSALDVAWEGFDMVKFPRSIYMGAFWGLIFSYYSDSAQILVFAGLGMDRMAIEFYKTFIRRMKSGKFKSEKPTIPSWVKKRQMLLTPYVTAWLVFIWLLAAFR